MYQNVSPDIILMQPARKKDIWWYQGKNTVVASSIHWKAYRPEETNTNFHVGQPRQIILAKAVKRERECLKIKCEVSMLKLF